MVEASNILLGVVGKTNVGKSTFFSAATMVPVEIENRPFVTIEPNVGVAYVKTRCAHVELGLEKCDPVNSVCLSGWRMIPVKLMDVAGLVPGAHEGRGLGNQFLDHLRRADGLLLVVDASGATDPEGVPVKPGMFDPVEEVAAMLREIDEWIYNTVRKDWDKVAKQIDTLQAGDIAGGLAQRLSGFSITRRHVAQALDETGLANKKLSNWTPDELRAFLKRVREISKPYVIVANKIDMPGAEENLERLRRAYGEDTVVPTSALAELLLKKLAREGVVRYIPGDSSFEIVKGEKLSKKEKLALEKIRELMARHGGTGVQQAIDTLVLRKLDMIPVYPVDDPNKYTDKEGRVLPDVVLVPRGTTARQLAYKIHSDLGETFIYAINAKTKQRIGESYVLNPGDVIKIVAAKR
ncbi:MAG: redox-regulated ATPase YchF [Desulfurococcales archaeon]|nr:redox-regulated ATPase YchF [Desulfurococcales archaeon]